MLSQDHIAFLSTSLTFWNHLSKAEKDLLISGSAPVTYKQGELIHGGENDCIGVLLIKSGRVRTYILSEDGREITIYRLSGGDVCMLSASCLLQSITFDVYIDAETDCEMLLIHSPSFSKLTAQNIYAECFSYKTAVDRFSDVMWTMEQILFMSFDKRLAIFLINEAAKHDLELITLTHEQIAKFMGSAREVVSRMLKYFANEGMVELSRGGVKIIDKKKLHSLT